MFPMAGALPTPVLVEKVAFYLEGYNAQFTQELLVGFVHGFRLHFQGTHHGPLFIEPAISIAEARDC